MLFFRSWLNSLRTFIATFNLFPSTIPSNDESEIKNQLLSTRIYLCLLVTGLITILIYESQLQIKNSITVESPSVLLYLSLYQDYNSTIICPCSTIAMNQREFISLSPKFHEVCTSDFVKSSWVNSINAVATTYLSNDFRNTGSLLFKILASFCNLANASIIDGLRRFYYTNFVSATLMSEELLRTKTISLIDGYILTSTNAFAYSFELIRDTTFANALISGLVTNIKFKIGNYDPLYDGYSGQPSYITYNTSNQCNCEQTPLCIEPAIIRNRTFNLTDFVVPGFYTGCYLIEAMRQSNLECLYNQSCIDQLLFHLQLSAILNLTALSYSMGSHFDVSANLTQLLDMLLVDTWHQNISFSSYYHQCQPSHCTYVRVERNSVSYIVIKLISLLGGIHKILFFSVPLFVQLLRRRKTLSISQTYSNLQESKNA